MSGAASITRRKTKSGVRYVVRYRLGGRAHPVQLSWDVYADYVQHGVGQMAKRFAEERAESAPRGAG